MTMLTTPWPQNIIPWIDTQAPQSTRHGRKLESFSLGRQTWRGHKSGSAHSRRYLSLRIGLLGTVSVLTTSLSLSSPELHSFSSDLSLLSFIYQKHSPPESVLTTSQCNSPSLLCCWRPSPPVSWLVLKASSAAMPLPRREGLTGPRLLPVALTLPPASEATLAPAATA